jgi:hypothetical protein
VAAFFVLRESRGTGFGIRWMGREDGPSSGKAEAANARFVKCHSPAGLREIGSPPGLDLSIWAREYL